MAKKSEALFFFFFFYSHEAKQILLLFLLFLLFCWQKLFHSVSFCEKEKSPNFFFFVLHMKKSSHYFFLLFTWEKHWFILTIFFFLKIEEFEKKMTQFHTWKINSPEKKLHCGKLSFRFSEILNGKKKTFFCHSHEEKLIFKFAHKMNSPLKRTEKIIILEKIFF